MSYKLDGVFEYGHISLPWGLKAIKAAANAFAMWVFFGVKAGMFAFVRI
jgi:hypothetical protein